MIKRMRKSCFWLSVVLMSFTMSGCGGGSDGSSGTGGNEGAPAIVTVTDYSGIRIPNATVVLGDSNGAMKSYGKTDAEGQITFDHAPSDATVTAATTCLQSGSTTTTYSINIQFDVNGSAVLSLNNCADTAAPLPVDPPAVDPILGTLTVNVTNTPIEVTRNQMTVGRQRFIRYAGLITRQTITLRESDLDNGGTFSVVVQGMDDQYNTVSYGILTGLTFTDGMTVGIPMQPMSFVQYQISNIPTTASTLRSTLSTYNGSQSFWSDQTYALLSAPSFTTIAAAYVPGFGTEVSYQIAVELDLDHNGVVDSRQNLSLDLSGSAPSDQSFDLSDALSAPHATVLGANTATPTLSWSGVDPTSTSVYISAIVRSSTSSWYLSFNNLMRSRTSIKYPELPNSLAAFRPNKVDYLAVYSSAFEGNLYKSSSGYYQATY